MVRVQLHAHYADRQLIARIADFPHSESQLGIGALKHLAHQAGLMTIIERDELGQRIEECVHFFIPLDMQNLVARRRRKIRKRTRAGYPRA